MSDPKTNLKKKKAANKKIHEEFINDTYSRVKEFDFTSLPKHSDNVAVLLEPRPHPHMAYVLRNIMHFLGEGWGLHIVGSRSNRDFILELTKGWTAVSFGFLDVDNLSREEFRKLRKSPNYWASLPGKKLLCFEVDTLLCRSGIDAFMDYDYIGAPWGKGYAVSDVVRVGNGGLSIRSKQAMIDMCVRGKPNVIPSEDSFFSIQLQLHADEYRLPEVETAQKFSVESMYYPTPLGFHKPWMYLSKAELLTIYNSIDYS